METHIKKLVAGDNEHEELRKWETAQNLEEKEGLPRAEFKMCQDRRILKVVEIMESTWRSNELLEMEWQKQIASQKKQTKSNILQHGVG